MSNIGYHQKSIIDDENSSYRQSCIHEPLDIWMDMIFYPVESIGDAKPGISTVSWITFNSIQFCVLDSFAYFIGPIHYFIQNSERISTISIPSIISKKE